MAIELLWWFRLRDLGLRISKAVIEMVKDQTYAIIAKSKVIESFNVHK